MPDTPPHEVVGRLISEVSRLWRTHLDKRLQPLGLSQAKWVVLVLLKEAGEAGLLQRELAEMSSVEAPTMASLLDRMEKEGWIARRTVASDRRCKTTLLTPKAEAATDSVFAEARRLRDELCRDLDHVGLQHCVDTLAQIKERLLRLPS